MSEGKALDDWFSGTEVEFEEDLKQVEKATQAGQEYDIAKKAKVGSRIACPMCGKTITKRSYQHTFCSNRGRNNCKDRFWNLVDERRTERARRRLGMDEDSGYDEYTYEEHFEETT